MKTATIFCLVTFLAGISFAQEKSFKERKNLLEFGVNAMSFMDGHGFSGDQFQFYPGFLCRLPYISYERSLFKRKLIIGVSFYNNSHVDFNSSEDRIGEPYIRIVQNFCLSFSGLIKPNNFIRIKPGVTINRRTGMDFYYLDNYFPMSCVTNLAGQRLNSYGLGPKIDVNFLILRRIELGFHVGYTHYFEKKQIQDGSDAISKNYQPNRDLLISHMKLGVNF